MGALAAAYMLALGAGKAANEPVAKLQTL